MKQHVYLARALALVAVTSITTFTTTATPASAQDNADNGAAPAAASPAASSSGAASAGNPVPVQTLDRVVAIVDEDVILYSELQDAVTRVGANAQRSGRELPPTDQFRRQCWKACNYNSLIAPVPAFPTRNSAMPWSASPSRTT